MLLELRALCLDRQELPVWFLSLVDTCPLPLILSSYLPLTTLTCTFVADALGLSGAVGPTGPADTCDDVRHCLQFGPGPCGCTGSTPVPCFATVGCNIGQFVCAPNCIKPQFVHPDCSSCIDISSGPSPSPKSDGKGSAPAPAPKGPSPAGKGSVPSPPKGKTSPSKGKSSKDKSSKGGKRRSLRQAEVDMMML